MLDQCNTLMPIQDAVHCVMGKRFSRITVHSWRKTGKLECVKAGRQWFCTVGDVRAMVARETKEAKKNMQWHDSPDQTP